MRKVTSVVLGVTLVLTVLVSYGRAASNVINLSMGSVSSSSGIYAFAVSLASVVHKYDPEIVVTAVEGGGGFDHAKLMKQGILNWSISGSPSVYNDVRQGNDVFKKEGPWEPVRLMFMRNINITRIYVRADVSQTDKIRLWADLKGKPFCPGIPGTRDTTRMVGANTLLGTGVKLIPSSLEDANNAIRLGKIIGMAKGSPHDRFDQGMMETHYTTPLTVIGFTKEEAQKIQANDPLDTFLETPVGGIRELPKLGSLWEMSSAVMVMTSSKMSQEIGYRIMKAVYKGWNDINTAYAPTKGLDPILDAFKLTPASNDFYFHAGVIQYAKEQGMKVPDRFIPSEYKGK
jgi:uncharacterized protein